MKKTPQIILALDVDTRAEAMRWVKRLYPEVGIFKVGLKLYTAGGPSIVRDIEKTGARVFLDLKFNDIPNTMADATKELLKYKVSMFTVHTLSGPAALEAVASACAKNKTKALGVTILTSIGARFLKDLKITRSLAEEALYLARMAKRCGLSGVVCSAGEAVLMRKHLGRDFLIVCPGIRMKGDSRDDQSRSATPGFAASSGVDYIVVGRPVLKAKEPLKAIEAIKRQLNP
ncbi:MAG: orotidine-5'-phosphate decarboxylase [Candidatus Omnitrophica bacterium]|nr:orotidine-5'-phosphate decarboxylase [Candidatus Omnitrophota bacterium]